ncbi:MAG TPA: hypothetical protein VNP72_01140 [Longimicrobium sp.]|nr:hypothetical protein [Longimicrobium sp.]
MAFTDAQLNAAMAAALVADGVMTAAEQATLLADPTENTVRDGLTAAQLGNFNTYWATMTTWLTNNGGDITTITGTNVQGRTGGNPAGMALKSLYNDAFRDVRTAMPNPGFSQVKAVSAQLRFIANT